MTLRKPALVLFDLDGTLVDTAPDLAWSIDATLQQPGLPVCGEDNVRGWIGSAIEGVMKRTLTNDFNGQPDDHFSVNADTALMVGDSITDINAARAAGFQDLCVPYVYNMDRDIYDLKPDAVAETLAELEQVLEHEHY